MNANVQHRDAHLYMLMQIPTDRQALETSSCGAAGDEALNLYIDGELPVEKQAELFHHLASCEPCRRFMGAMMEFRRMSRCECLTVPSALDDAFFKVLDKSKQRSRRRDRYADRRPLWQVRGTVSLRAGLLFAVLLFGAGLLFPHNAGMQPKERLELYKGAGELTNQHVMYVFYPGLTIEVARGNE